MSKIKKSCFENANLTLEFSIKWGKKSRFDRHHFCLFYNWQKTSRKKSDTFTKTFEIMICSLLKTTRNFNGLVGRSVGFISLFIICSFHSNPSRHLTKIKCLFITLLTCVCLFVESGGEIVVHKHCRTRAAFKWDRLIRLFKKTFARSHTHYTHTRYT